jgi:UDP-N-acetylmuramate: L-alanyl-gamma-D-glutamyl-meso-diaminopimelate ligase
MRVHFIAIGGSAMHNLAIALKKKGYHVTGSDDEIFEPSRTRLQNYGLLPDTLGWDPNRIQKGIDAIILGMHAKENNPELVKATKLGLKIFSYPEFLYQQSRDKTRIVIGGSHGKTTITSMILHVLQHHKFNTDYMVGAQLKGFDVMVKLSEDAPFMVLEGDEYLSSALDKRPKFHLYRPHIALLSGIAWDHMNVFPTFENYLDQFRIFIQKIEENGKLIYCEEDPVLKQLCEEQNSDLLCLYPYKVPDYEIEDGITYVKGKKNLYPLNVFGRHNLLNLSGALSVCKQLGLTNPMFYEAMKSFKGASNRLELLDKNENTIVFKDFAHAPSKVKATVRAVKEQYPGRRLFSFLELHTYSSLNENFLDEYRNSLEMADDACVFYNPHALKIKGLPDVSPERIYSAFNKPGLQVIDNPDLLKKSIMTKKQDNSCFLFMSSGNFGNLKLQEIAGEIVTKKIDPIQ